MRLSLVGLVITDFEHRLPEFAMNGRHPEWFGTLRVERRHLTKADPDRAVQGSRLSEPGHLLFCDLLDLALDLTRQINELDRPHLT